MTKTKIRINDDETLRKLIDKEYENSSKSRMCRFAIAVSKHIFRLLKYPLCDEVKSAFKVNEKWQKNEASVNDARKAAFIIHKLAKQSTDPIVSAALRAAGHAVASAHAKEHAMVAADYAIKVINLYYPDDMEAVKKQRIWQLNKLKEIKDPKQ